MKKFSWCKETLEKELKELKSSKKVAEKYGCCHATIKKKIRDFGIYHTRNDINHDFFDHWSHDMAYILGFLTADGNIHNRRPYIYVELKRADECVLQYILSKVYPSSKIYHYEHLDKRRNVLSQSSKIAIFSRRLIQKLEEYSIFPNKTGKHRIDFHIPHEFIGDYVRGFFDGDGSAWISKRSNIVHVSFCCQSHLFLEDLKKLIGLKGIISYNEKPPKLRYHADSEKIGELMYQDSNSFCLSRKKEKFQMAQKRVNKVYRVSN